MCSPKRCSCLHIGNASAQSHDAGMCQDVWLHICWLRRRMDFILEKDAQRKNSRKHKRQRTSTSTTQHPNSSTNSSCPHALEAFGKVVHYCTAAHCRRSILLGHFGEVLTSNASCNRQQQHSRDTKAPMLYGHTLLLAPESAAGVAHNTSMVDHGPYRTTEHPHDVQPCCDFCDAAACVAAAVSSLREIEAASVIQRSSKHSWGNYGLCSARQKAADGDLLSFERGMLCDCCIGFVGCGESPMYGACKTPPDC